MADISRMPWEMIDTGTDDLPFRIEPGSKLSRFISGKRIRFYEDHARHLLAQALAGRVGRIHRQILKHITRCQTAFNEKTPLDHLKAFAWADVRRVFETCGLPGLIALAEGPSAGIPEFGHDLAGCNEHDDVWRSALSSGLFSANDRLVPMLAGHEVPSKSVLIKQVAYVRDLGWTIKRGVKFPWIVKGSRSFERQLQGCVEGGEKAVARTVIALAIKRIIPASRLAINKRMSSVDDLSGARQVRIDLCAELEEVIRRCGYSGLLAMSGAGRRGET